VLCSHELLPCCVCLTNKARLVLWRSATDTTVPIICPGSGKFMLCQLTPATSFPSIPRVRKGNARTRCTATSSDSDAYAAPCCSFLWKCGLATRTRVCGTITLVVGLCIRATMSQGRDPLKPTTFLPL